MATVGFYGRVSSDEQAEKNTVQSQIDYAERYFELHGAENNIEEVIYYIDEGVSGTIPLPERPAGAKLINDIKSKKISILFMYRLDRLARSVKHVLDTHELMLKHDIALKSMTEAFDTGSPTGKFFMTLLASIAALERETILERTQLGKIRNAKGGRWVNGPTPFGYKLGEDGKLIIEESEAEIVRLVFFLYNDGMKMKQVAQYLNAKEIPTRSRTNEGKWVASAVAKILNAETYTGKAQYLKSSQKNAEPINISVPAIIDEQIFENTQKLIDANSDIARRVRGRNYLLSGLIFCADCGLAMTGSSGSGGERYYYRCMGTTDYGSGKRCDAKLLRADEVENAVWKDIRDLLLNPQEFRDIVSDELKQNKENMEPIQKELVEVEQSIIEKQEARGRIVSLIRKNIISEQEGETELKQLASEIQSLNARREFLFGKIESIQQFENDALDTQIILNNFTRNIHLLDNPEGIPAIDPKDKEDIIRGVVRRVNIYTILNEDGKKRSQARIQYRFIRCVDSSDSADSKPNTTFFHLESTWIFQAFSKSGGERLRWR